MKVVIYDRNPGKGINNKFLMFSWAFAAFFQKLFGIADKVHGASSWDDAISWLSNMDTNSFSSIQYWGHGSPGVIWLKSERLLPVKFLAFKNKLLPETIIWFRTCSAFHGKSGYDFSRYLADNLNCVIAGHTRIIGILQSGLHTRKPETFPSWSIYEGNEKDDNFWKKLRTTLGLIWGNNTVFCLQNKVPKDW